MNNNSEITITSTVGGTSKAISNLTQTSPVVVTTTNHTVLQKALLLQLQM